MPTPHHQILHTVRHSIVAATAILLLAASSGCRRSYFPDVPDGYQEFAYVTNGTANTVTVLDLVYLRRTAPSPSASTPPASPPTPTPPTRPTRTATRSTSSTANPAPSPSSTPKPTRRRHHPRPPSPLLHQRRRPGHRAYVANSGSNNVSILDLDRRREIAVVGTGEAPGLARISPDMRSLVVTNRASGSVSIFNVIPYPAPPQAPHLRSVYSGCPGATDAVFLPDSAKAFIACSAGHQVMAISLAADPRNWPGKKQPIPHL